ncbi:hypothetical protein [Thalassovita sp.]|uniref:hypothetical protein n=1 Tax=Thalassovita sp. TaxID=1979401 RepID=UPI0029DE63E0|nr:hypothetical protein [Thalassovita sp.]
MSPLQNRVQPTGEISALTARGTLTGNRGILHRPDGTLGPSRWKHTHWVCCELCHNGRYHGPMPANGWTALFFLDEAVALAAGHRPCHACRRPDAHRFHAAWETAHGPLRSTAEIDSALHPTRVTRSRQQVRHTATAESLPPGTFILTDGPYLLTATAALRYSPAGYVRADPRPTGAVTVLTPAPVTAVLANGYLPRLHPSSKMS